MAVAVVYRSDVRSVLREVAPNDSSRVVPAAEIYKVYVARMVEQGREPVTMNAFGRALTQCGQRGKYVLIDGRNVWCRVIHEKFMAGEQYDTEPARLSNRNG